MQQTANVLPDLYEADETAWLESMSELIQQGRLGELDYPHLSEYLADMARRDRREVESRLAILLMHALKWDYQPKKRSKSWRNTILVQRQELARLLVSGALRNHADAVLGDIYLEAIARTATQTKLPAGTFPEECPYTLDHGHLQHEEFLGELESQHVLATLTVVPTQGKDQPQSPPAEELASDPSPPPWVDVENDLYFPISPPDILMEKVEFKTEPGEPHIILPEELARGRSPISNVQFT